ncbi:MAG: hypothetical protein ACYCY5_12285 [Sulfuricella sp.]
MLGRLKQLIGKLYVIALMGYAIWFGYFIYPLIFSHGGHEEGAQHSISTDLKMLAGVTSEEKALHKIRAEQKATETTDLGYVVLKEQYVKGHFHHIGMTVETDETNVCIKCHGAVPHNKAKTIRAFLNMHAFYIACETCHINTMAMPDQAPWTFRWYDKKTGQAVANPPALVSPDLEKYGNYGAKIAPGAQADNGTFRFINGDEERLFLAKYLKTKDAMDSTEQARMKRVMHNKVSEKPLLCEDCHTSEKSYLPFAELGYPPRRIDRLENTAVVGMINKYRDFYLPRFFELHGEQSQTPITR